MLGGGGHGEKTGGQHERSDEDNLSYLDHPELDARGRGGGRIFARTIAMFGRGRHRGFAKLF
jgi:hypothetical protein